MTVSLLHPNQWDRFHWAAVYAAAIRVYEEGRDHPYHADAKRPETIYRQIITGELKSVIADKFLILYDYGPTPLSNSDTLFETIVVRMGNFPGNLSAIPKALEQLARMHGCRYVAAGNSIARKGLARIYEREGFIPIATQYQKEVL